MEGVREGGGGREGRREGGIFSEKFPDYPV